MLFKFRAKFYPEDVSEELIQDVTQVNIQNSFSCQALRYQKGNRWSIPHWAIFQEHSLGFPLHRVSSLSVTEELNCLIELRLFNKCFVDIEVLSYLYAESLFKTTKAFLFSRTKYCYSVILTQFVAYVMQGMK